jgi:cytochrome c oxidase cbb3-type subunit 3
MSDFTSGFWNIYIVVLTLIGILGCGLLLWSQSKHKITLPPAPRRRRRPRATCGTRT